MVDLYILDTDCVSLILYNHPQLIANKLQLSNRS